MPYVGPHEAHDTWIADLGDADSQRDPPPWRRPLLANADTRAVLICWPPGFQTIPHHHPQATETFQVVSGRLGFRLDDRAELRVGAGAILIAHRGQVHGLRVLGSTPLVLLACVSPNVDSPHEQVDVPDAWPDWRASPAAGT